MQFSSQRSPGTASDSPEPQLQTLASYRVGVGNDVQALCKNSEYFKDIAQVLAYTFFRQKYYLILCVRISVAVHYLQDLSLSFHRDLGLSIFLQSLLLFCFLN